MTDKARLCKSIDSNEGFRSLPYLDTKNLYTFGKGRCLETNPLTAEEWRHLIHGNLLAVAITEKGADWLMWREIDGAESACKRNLDFWGELNDARQNVLVEMVYQMGIIKVLGFRKMLRAIAAQDWETAYKEGLDSDWHRNDSPRRARELMLIMRDGEFSN